ncbi:MAG: ATP-binding protein [Halioglobus sp.]
MARLILVCGPTGAGKTTHSIAICKEIKAVRFSIDPWMQTMFSADMTTLDYDWMIERVNRCSDQIWQVSEQILGIDGNVVLDLGFTTKAQRAVFFDRAKGLNINAELHYLDAAKDVRRGRVDKRNEEKDSAVYSFDVTDMMFDFMEPMFETPDQNELKNGCKVGE